MSSNYRWINLILALLLFVALPNYAQEVKPSLDKSQAAYTIAPKSMPAKAPAGFIPPSTESEKKQWSTQVNHLGGFQHQSEMGPLDSLKAAKLIEKLAWKGTPSPEGTEKVMIAPFVDEEFNGNLYNGWRPQDNDLAISESGFIVSVVNSNISYYTQTGGVIKQSEPFSDFYDFLNLNGSYFDPRVVYDPVEQKFILVVLNGSTPSNSNVVVSFSISDNPSDGWWTYTFEGNAPSPNLWFDFPNIGISGEDLFISGNFFTSNNNFNQSAIYQLDKDAGFIGENITWEYFDNVTNADGADAGSIKPLSLGYAAGYGPGIYLVSSAGFFSNKVHLYDIDGDVEDNQMISVFGVNTPNYSAPGNAFQANTDKLLDTGDARTQSGYYANGLAHFVFQIDAGAGFTGIRYNRLNVANLSNQVKTLSTSGFDSAYPAVAMFSDDITDPTALIAYTRTGETIFPELRVVSIDEDMDFSNTILVKEGESFIDASDDNVQRWGDYSGISRQHSASEATAWVFGTYGRNETYGNWIAEIKRDESNVAPVANFQGTPTSGQVTLQVVYQDLSTNNPTSWVWEFEGGNPAISTVQNPSVIYTTPGTYDVTLTVTNAAGQSTQTLSDYITVNAQVFPPAANFSSNVTSGNAPFNVNFSDQSINTPTSWNWTFEGGNPATSDQKNPVVSYSTEGTYDVTLEVTNAAGSDVETKLNYITVNGSVSTSETALQGSLQMSPNPTMDLFQLEFSVPERIFIEIDIVDESGRMVKNLFADAVKPGKNQLQFNRGALGAGTYFIIIRDQNAKTIKYEKLVILN